MDFRKPIGQVYSQGSDFQVHPLAVFLNNTKESDIQI